MARRISFPLLALASLVVSQTCPIQFDGRIPANATLELLDTSNSPFNPDYVFGQGLAWSEIIKLPDVPTSLLDAEGGTIALEVTINDDSIFAPSADNIQTGFRRAELQPMSNDGSDPSTQGVKTLHFSLRKDTERPLNFTHEYQLVFVETADYSTNQFALKTGTILDHAEQENPDSLILQSNVRDPTDLFTVAFDPDVWHNFGLYMDFTGNKMQVYYSIDNEPLASVTELVSNDLSGQGQYHFGILKKPTGENLGDITKEGYQESGIDEGIIFGGIFEEDSEGNCITVGG